MTFRFMGVDWHIVAITVFVFSMIFTTEIVKTIIKKLLKKKLSTNLNKSKLLSLFISWIVGFICFHLVYIYLDIPIEKIAYMQFIGLTVLANGGYTVLKPLVMKIKKLKE